MSERKAMAAASSVSQTPGGCGQTESPKEGGLPERRDLPIGVLDSGVGGISVLREMVRLMPGEDFLFYGDAAYAPYGTKTRQQVCERTLACVEEMMQTGIKALVVACNTATSAAIEVLREKYDRQIPVVGIEPALKPAVSGGRNGGGKPTVLVMATPGTVAGEKWKALTRQYEGKAKILSLPCPGLMEYVERGILEGDELNRFLRDLLGELPRSGVDAVVLGCTHYPFVRHELEKIFSSETRILDGSEGTARQLLRRLKKRELLRMDPSHEGQVTFTGSGEAREDFCRMLLEWEP
ncbi:MAG: glutamate racemase [Lachnospiraceae bacterium]|nr:glutamate racemase [Lachnospiraceae bacterium]